MMTKFAMRSMMVATLVVLASGAAIAQENPQPAGDEAASEIVVKGRNQDKQVREFIGALTEVPREGSVRQIRQFVWDVCPVAIGLSDGQNAAIVRRMRRIAAEAGVPLAKEKCTPNVILIVTDAKDASIADMIKRYPNWFAGVLTHDWKKLKKESGPATVWQNETLIQAAQIPDASRIFSQVQPVFANAFIVVDLQALDGLSIKQLADYAAMRGFARTNPDRAAETGTPTILTLFDDRAAGRALPASLTDWDRYFLKSLYATTNDFFETYQRGWIEQRFKKELKRQRRLREGETQGREGEKP